LTRGLLNHLSWLLLVRVIIQRLVEFELLHVLLVLDLHVFGDVDHSMLMLARVIFGRGALVLAAFVSSGDHCLHVDDGAVAL
jgi:hypothetical protein